MHTQEQRLCTIHIKNALGYVHYWESRERGSARKSLQIAANEAVKICGLTERERGVLFGALHLESEAR